MSQGEACKNRTDHWIHWRVEVRRANYSAFNGGRRTPSDYSLLVCRACGATWRTRAAYVGQVADA